MFKSGSIFFVDYSVHLTPSLFNCEKQEMTNADWLSGYSRCYQRLSKWQQDELSIR